MKSILWILNGCGLEWRGITGGPVRFHEVSRRFAELGHAQHLVTTPGGRKMLTALGSTLEMTIVPASLLLRSEPCRPFRLWSYFITSLLWRFNCRSVVRSDVVITASDYFCDVVPAIGFKRRFGAKWIAFIHHCEAEPGKRPGLRLVNEITYRMQRWSFRRIARFADAAWISDTLAGDEIEKQLAACGMPKDRIRRMLDGIDLGSVLSVPVPEKKTFDAVMVGVRPNKGMHDIIPIWRRVQEMRPGTSLLLMGGMSGERDVVARIGEEKLPVSVLRPEGGFLPAAQYIAKLKQARVMFAPSHEEGWGIAVCEAMAAGLPVVAYDLPAYRKIYADAYVSVPCFDHGHFAESVVKALDDQLLAADYAKRGAAAAAKYDWKRIAEADSLAIERMDEPR